MKCLLGGICPGHSLLLLHNHTVHVIGDTAVQKSMLCHETQSTTRMFVIRVLCVVLLFLDYQIIRLMQCEVE